MCSSAESSQQNIESVIGLLVCVSFSLASFCKDVWSVIYVKEDPFKSEILEMFTKDSLVKIMIGAWNCCESVLLKKNAHQKDTGQLKNKCVWYAKRY